MAVQLPRVLKNLNLFIDGRGYAGRCDEIQLPKLTLKTEEYRGGGMDLPVELEMGMEKLEAQLTLSDMDPEVFRAFGILGSGGTDLPVIARSAFQAQGGAVAAEVVTMRGGWKEVDPGNRKVGEKGSLVLQVSLTYFKYEFDGEELVEIDAINMVRRINGVDQLEAQRQALGL